MRWTGHVARVGKRRGVYSVLVEKPERTRSLGRPRPKWEYNIKTDVQEVRWSDMDWIELAQNSERWRAVVSAQMHFHDPQNMVNFLTN